MNALEKLWSRLTEPHPSITEPEKRHRAHLLSAALLSFTILVALALLAACLFIYRTFDPFALPLTALGLAALVVFALNYLLSRTRRAALAAPSFVCIVLLASFASIAAAPREAALLVFLTLALQLGGLFLTERAFVFLFALELLGTLLLAVLLANWSPEARVSAIMVVFMFGALNFILANIQSNDRQRIARQARELFAENAERRRTEETLRRDYQEREQRADELFETLVAISALDFEKHAQVHGTDDIFDALAVGVNMLGEELQERIAQYRESEARFRNLAENIPAVTYIAALDAVASTLYTSPQIEPMLGITLDEWMADPELWAKSLHPEDRERVLAEYNRATAAAEPFRAEYRLVRRDGAAVWVRDESTIIEDENGCPRYQQGVMHDITGRVQMVEDLRRARDAAEAASRAKSEFLSVLSHELRTPLNAILGFAQLLEGDATRLSPRAARGAQQIGQSGRRMLAMVDNLLDYTRGDLDGLALDLRTVDAAEAIQAVCAELAPAIAAKQLRLAIGALPAACAIRADPRRLAQILRILIGNAIEFTPEDGQVIVDCEWQMADSGQPPAILRIGVRDTGVGIGPELLPLLFRPFTQQDTSTTRAHGGLGLSLALARRLVEAHGGRIWAESAGAGQGSTFYFELPLQQARARPKTSEEGE